MTITLFFSNFCFCLAHLSHSFADCNSFCHFSCCSAPFNFYFVFFFLNLPKQLSFWLLCCCSFSCCFVSFLSVSTWLCLFFSQNFCSPPTPTLNLKNKLDCFLEAAQLLPSQKMFLIQTKHGGYLVCRVETSDLVSVEQQHVSDLKPLILTLRGADFCQTLSQHSCFHFPTGHI